MATSDEDFQTFFRKNFTRAVYGVSQITGCSQQEAEDGTQEAMIRLRERWDDVTNHYAFLITTALRIVYDATRSSSRRHDREARYQETYAWISEAGEASELSARHMEVIAALHALPFEQRTVVALDIDGCTTAEIAGYLQISQRGVVIHRSKARKALRAALSPI